MIVIPAIDLKGGQCVRLRQGRFDDVTIFSNSPSEIAKKWEAAGGHRLHLVDLDGASSGKPENRKAVEEIVKAVSIPVDLGGGIRNIETIDRYLNIGLDYVILGTAAVKNPHLVDVAAEKYPGKILVGIDAKNGFVATDGWLETSEVRVESCIERFAEQGVAEIIYTDISKDGMMEGPNFASIAEVAERSALPIIASGGYTELEDVKKTLPLEEKGVSGFILGRSIYEGTIDLAEAVALVEQNR